MKPLRCSYCNRASVVILSYLGFLAATRRRWIPVRCGSCAEHENSVNWRSMLELAKSGRWRNVRIARVAA